jgi:hypothetical protein
MTGAGRGPFREGILELLAGANQDVVAPMLLAPRAGFARAALALGALGALALTLLPWVPLQAEAAGRLVDVDGQRARFVSAAPAPARAGARVRLEVVTDDGGASLTLDGRVVRATGEVVEVAIEGDVTPRAGAGIGRFTLGRASPLALLARAGGGP